MPPGFQTMEGKGNGRLTLSPMGPFLPCLPLRRAAAPSLPSDMPTSSSACAAPAPLTPLPRPLREVRPPAELPPAAEDPLPDGLGRAFARRAAAAPEAIFAELGAV